MLGKELELADGDPKVLAMLCKPDLSEIRKDGFLVGKVLVQ